MFQEDVEPLGREQGLGALGPLDHAHAVGFKELLIAKAGDLFERLFHAFFRRLNLGYLDRAPAAESVQATSPYALCRLSQVLHEGTHTSTDLMAELFLPEVQDALREEPSNGHMAELTLKTRILNPLQDFGLLTLEPAHPEDTSPWFVTVRKTPLFGRFVALNLDLP